MDAADCIPQGFFSRNLFKKAWKIVKTAVKKNVVAELSSFRLPLSDSNLKWTSAIMITLVRIICLNFPFLRSRVKVWLLYSAGRRARWDLERTNWVKAESESKWITPYNNRAMRKWDKKNIFSDFVQLGPDHVIFPFSFPVAHQTLVTNCKK